MAHWNQFQPEIMLARRYGYPKTGNPQSYKEQAKLELLRRLALEDEYQELQKSYNLIADQKEALELELDLLKIEHSKGLVSPQKEEPLSDRQPALC